MNLDALRVFTLIAQTGSIHGAAIAGAGSRTTVRRKLEELEETLGVQLVHRGPRGVTLTEAGLVLGRRGEQLIHEATILAQTVREVALDPARPIRLTVPPGISPQHHAAAFSFARQIWPDGRLELRTGKVPTLAAIRETDVYVTMVSEKPEGPFTTYRLPDVALVLLASPQYVETSGPINSIEALLEHPIFVWDPPDGLRIETLPTMHGPPIDFDAAYSSDDIHVLHEMAAAGLGIALVPHPAAPNDEADFVQVLPELVGESHPVWLLISDAVADSPRLQQLAELVEQVAKL